MRQTVIGIVAHVDAGKTTLTEAMLYTSGAIDKLGRVDKRDAFLDTHSLERERGITIFSKMASMELAGGRVTLIDTPGHVDFSCECERALSVEDYAILVISATDGVTAHTRTLWHLLSARRIPTFIFVNKCDIADRRRQDLLAELRVALSPSCQDFSRGEDEEFFEGVAGSDVKLMEEYFDGGTISTDSIRQAIRRRTLFPCYFGSALKLKGVDVFLDGINKYVEEIEYPSDMFGARIYKIDRDAQGRRVAFTKITGGSLAPKSLISYKTKSGETREEKIEEIRLFDGDKSSPLKLATPGVVCAIYGTEGTEAGMGLGFEHNDSSMLAPVLNYSLKFKEGVDPYEVFMRLSPLAEEDPSLGLTYNESLKEIRLSLMGDIQREILTDILKERFGVECEFDEGRILYKETVADEVIGSGHFEPLRHYAEVHLRIEPLPEGSGVIAATECAQDDLALNWQRLVITHIKERVHRGTSIGAPLTDVKITLLIGKAHQKHTSGGDFRQATYRAIRQGLRKAGTVILEPTFDFRVELPRDNLGRLLTDVTAMRGSVKAPEIEGDLAIVEGNCPVETMRSYSTTLRAYTKGAGRIAMTVGPYVPHSDQEALREREGYDPDRDERNTADSVFCKAGAGYLVPWYEADELMHLSVGEAEADEEEIVAAVQKRKSYQGSVEEDKELERIFEATYGKIRRKSYSERVENKASEAKPKGRRTPRPRGDEYLIIDGYNVIYDWDMAKRGRSVDFDIARQMLIRSMCSYAAFKRVRVIIVFDAHGVKGGEGSVEKYGDVTVVYTRSKQTADTYIEKATYQIADTNYVRVVSSDLEEQFVILGNGAYRVSAREFKRELGAASLEMQEIMDKYTVRG